MTGKVWRRNFWILWMGQFVATAGLTVMVPLLPLYMEELGARGAEANRWWTGICLAAPAVTLFLASPLWGRIGDQWGRKWMVVRALFGLSVCMGLMGAAQSPVQFLLFRLLQGVCGGVVDAAAAFVGSDAPEHRHGRVLGHLQSATAAGSLFGPLIGGLLADGWGTRPLYWLMAGLTAACGWLAALGLKEPRPSPGRSKRSPSLPIPDVFLALMGRPRLRAVILAGVCANAGVFGVVVVFAPWVRELAGTGGAAATWVGVLQAVTWGATVLGAPWWGRRNERSVRIERHFFWASLGCGVSVILQLIPRDPLWLLPLRILQGFCFSALAQTVFLKVTRNTEEAIRGTAIGMTNSFLVLGQVAGSLSAAFLGARFPTEGVFLLMGGWFLAAALLVFRPPAQPSRLPEAWHFIQSRIRQ